MSSKPRRHQGIQSAKRMGAANFRLPQRQSLVGADMPACSVGTTNRRGPHHRVQAAESTIPLAKFLIAVSCSVHYGGARLAQRMQGRSSTGFYRPFRFSGSKSNSATTPAECLLLVHRRKPDSEPYSIYPKPRCALWDRYCVGEQGKTYPASGN